ncbi:MAG: hypothetical protein P1U89_25035 [Verrucomicrobiales bacterium]|nr:hypothetical protein [Verrucomicrobiales bacterium]
MELSKYIEALTKALAEKLNFPAVATVDAYMSSEGTLHGGSVAIDGQKFNLGNLFSQNSAEANGVRVRFNINVA